MIKTLQCFTGNAKSTINNTWWNKIGKERKDEPIKDCTNKSIKLSASNCVTIRNKNVLVVPVESIEIDH